MSKIYSAFSNPKANLSELQYEFDFVINFFNKADIKKKVDHIYSKNKHVDKITSEIIAEQKQLKLFHFSGHSGGKGLEFTDGPFKSEHLIQFLNTICSDNSKIDCVFLNGCENENIVRQLSRVPVVIGTRSDVQDHVAAKFTEDFFSTLIKSGSTYHQAFLDATSAIENISRTIQDNTRSEGGNEEFETRKPLNDYFLIINDKRIAESTFPLKRGKTNWTKYLLLLFIVIALFLGWFFKDDIFEKAVGFSCPNIIEPDKCNFVIGDFVTDKPFPFDKFLSQTIADATIIKKYIKAVDIGSFDIYTNNNIHRDSLPNRCNYDFNLTGRYISDYSSLFKAEINITPSPGRPQSLDKFSYSVGYLTTLDTLLTSLNEKNVNNFLLYEMCIRCALKKDIPELSAVINKFVETIDSIHTTSNYQRLHFQLAEVNLRYLDTASALSSLDKISKAVGNNFALMAMERKIELYSGSNKILNVFETQSDLIGEFEARIQQPSQYVLNGDLKQYNLGQNNVRFDRAMLVLKYKDDQLKGFKNIAIQDFEYLQSIKYPPGDFSKEIKLLKDIQMDSISDKPVGVVEEFRLTGQVLTTNGKPLKDAVLVFSEIRATTNSKGEFNFGTFPDTMVLGRILSISLKGFQTQKIKISKSEIDKIILSELIDFQGSVFTESKQPLEGATLTFGNLKRQTNSAGQFDFGPITALKLFGKTLSISRNGFLDQNIKIDEKNIKNIVLVKAPVAIKVILQAIQTDDGQFQKILSYLKKQNYQIDSQRSINFKTNPKDFSKVSSVIYYRDENKSLAFTLAKQFQTWTGENLEVISPPSRTSSKSAVKTDYLTIQLVGTSTMIDLRGNVFTPRGIPLEGAVVTFNNLRKITDGKGLFDFGRYAKPDVIQKPLYVSHSDFQDNTILISEESISRIVLSNKLTAGPPDNYKVYMRALEINETFYRKVVSSLISAGYPIDLKSSTNSGTPNLSSEAPQMKAKAPNLNSEKLQMKAKSPNLNSEKLQMKVKTPNLTAEPPISKNENLSRIEYFHEGNKDRAYALAKQLLEWTKVDFKINKLSFTKSQTGIPKEEDILIHWVGTNPDKK